MEQRSDLVMLGNGKTAQGHRGRGTLEKEKPPVLGMIQRNGEVVICPSI